LKNGTVSILVNDPSLYSVIGNHLCSYLFFTFTLLFTNRMYLLASVGLKNVFTSSLAILKASHTQYFFIKTVS